MGGAGYTRPISQLKENNKRKFYYAISNKICAFYIYLIYLIPKDKEERNCSNEIVFDDTKVAIIEIILVKEVSNHYE